MVKFPLYAIYNLLVMSPISPNVVLPSAAPCLQAAPPPPGVPGAWPWATLAGGLRARVALHPMLWLEGQPDDGSAFLGDKTPLGDKAGIFYERSGLLLFCGILAICHL